MKADDLLARSVYKLNPRLAADLIDEEVPVSCANAQLELRGKVGCGPNHIDSPRILDCAQLVG